MTIEFASNEIETDFTAEFISALGPQLQSNPFDLGIRVFRRLSPCRPTSEAGLPEIFVSASRGLVTLGPLFIRGNSICFSCFSQAVERAAFDVLTHDLPGRDEALAAASGLGEYLEACLAASDFGILTDAIMTIAIPSLVRSVHSLVRHSDCPDCSAHTDRGNADLRLHCSPLTGIVRQLAATTAPRAGAWRAAAIWVPPLPLPGARPLLCFQESFGRGRTKAEAELGCIGEALERYSLIFKGNEPLVRARMSELAAIDPRSILLYSERQYQNRKAFNSENDELFFVGEPFDPELPIDWMPATSLTDGRTTYVPAACCLMWHRSREPEPEFARADTVGCASGRTFNDALEYALLEWIERDAMAIWWYNRLRRPEVPVESFGCQDLLRVEEGIRRIGRKLVLLDVTTDIAVPTYVSVAARHDGSEPLFAGASHPSPRVAAWKAASEVGQIWFGLHHRRSIDEPLRRWITHASTENQPYLAPLGSTAPPTEPGSRPAVEGRIEQLVRKLRRAGLQSFVVDHSRPDVLLKTVRAIVPGLRHIWNRRAPGRLYDVPVSLGWRESALSEDDLNPIICMI